MAYHLLVASPERTLFDGEVSSLILRSTSGDIAFLTGHVPIVTAVLPGEARITAGDGQTVRLAVHGGFVEMSSHGARLLVPVAERAEEIDVERARAAAARFAEATEAQAEEYAALVRARVRLSVAGQDLSQAH